MVTTTHRITVEDLERDGAPEGRWELINGELVAMPPSGGRHSRIGVEIGYLLLTYIKPRQLGYVYGADGGFVLSEEPATVRVPDVGFVRMDRLPPDFDAGGVIRVPPDLAVEVISPSDRMANILAKVAVWLEAGTAEVWVVAPEEETVTVFRGERAPETLAADEVLEGGDILPGFTLPVSEMFAL